MLSVAFPRMGALALSAIVLIQRSSGITRASSSACHCRYMHLIVLKAYNPRQLRLKEMQFCQVC